LATAFVFRNPLRVKRRHHGDGKHCASRVGPSKPFY
jgi:hypothetical protein